MVKPEGNALIRGQEQVINPAFENEGEEFEGEEFVAKPIDFKSDQEGQTHYYLPDLLTTKPAPVPHVKVNRNTPYNSIKNSYDPDKKDRAKLEEDAHKIKKTGIDLIMFDFDNTASKQHIYNMWQLNRSIVKDIIEKIHDEHMYNTGTYFSKCHEMLNSNGKRIFESNLYFFVEVVKALHKANILVAIVSRGECNVIQQVLNALFKTEDEREKYIPNSRIEGGDQVKPNYMCHKVYNEYNHEYISEGRSSGANMYKNKAILALLKDLYIDPSRSILIDDDDKNIINLNTGSNGIIIRDETGITYENLIIPLINKNYYKKKLFAQITQKELKFSMPYEDE